ncbi:diguanylate cyclase [Pannonibacter sp.]|uniref:diguanylate cyclase n=1 Tax=Pannonibacter sp. TaxID=1906786 RepID=UPI003F714087
MRISTITNWAYGVTLVLTILSGLAFILSSRSATDERVAVEHLLALDKMAEGLALGAELRTDEARLYVMRGDPRHLAAFHVAEAEERRREAAIGDARALGVTDEEMQLLERIRKDAEELDAIELRAIEAYSAGNTAEAQAILFGDQHYREHLDLITAVEEFHKLTERRTEQELRALHARSDLFGLIARITLSLTAAVFLAVLYFILRRRVALPLQRMTGIVNRLANQDFAVEVPRDGRRDEIGEMNDAIQVFRDNGLERARLDAERRQDLHTKDLILQMMHRVQACEKLGELADVVSRFLPQLFPHLPGGLYVVNDSHTALSPLTSWLEPQSASPRFATKDCWGLRRGRPHASKDAENDVSCAHVASDGIPSLCMPLTAQGDTIGMLYLEGQEETAAAVQDARIYLEIIAENLGLAIANLQLRERLMRLAVQDSLTGLLNRRSLDEALHTLAQDNTPGDLCCLMIDIDHFKHFNDEFGHDAGDVVMQSVAGLLIDIVGPQGQIYRFGGEEFTVLLPDARLDGALALAERIRTRIATTPLTHRGRILGTITVSIGLATSPHGGSIPTLRTRADLALLTAKESGRNRTCCEAAGPAQ